MDEKIGVDLEARLESMSDHDLIDVVVFLKEEISKAGLEEAADTEAASQDRGEVVGRMKDAADASQQSLLNSVSLLEATEATTDGLTAVPKAKVVERFWINNSVRLEVSREALQQLLDREDVSHIELVTPMDLSEILDARPLRSELPVESPALDAAPITWSVKHINAPLLWQIGHLGKDVVVAVVDTGVNYTHPDLEHRMWASTDYPNHGYDFGNDDDNPFDESGHGTSCAGIVAGDGSAGRATGVAPEATVMALRIGNTETSVWKCLEFAVAENADVISMSISWKYPRRPNYPGWRRVCETILAAGVVHANSIGNQGEQLAAYPIPYNIATPGNCPPPWLNPNQDPHAGITSAISCGATDSSDKLANYSGRGPAAWETGTYHDYPYADGDDPGLVKPDICAPGPGTTSCNWRYDPGNPFSNPYSGFGGTSSATPHVAGCLALLVSACKLGGHPVIPARLQEAVELTAVRIRGQANAKENHFGSGRIDVYAAYKYGLDKGWWSGPSS